MTKKALYDDVKKRLVMIGKEFKEKREKKKWSQRKLAQEVGLYQQQISEIEQGNINITIRTFVEIAFALDLDFEIVDKVKSKA